MIIILLFLGIKDHYYFTPRAKITNLKSQKKCLKHLFYSSMTKKCLKHVQKI